MNDSADLVGDANGDGVVNAEDGSGSDCPEGTVPNDGSDPTTNLICISGAPGSFSGVVYAGVLGVAVAAGLLAL